MGEPGFDRPINYAEVVRQAEHCNIFPYHGPKFRTLSYTLQQMNRLCEWLSKHNRSRIESIIDQSTGIARVAWLKGRTRKKPHGIVFQCEEHLVPVEKIRDAQ